MERFQDKRFWLGGGAVTAVLILAIAWFLLIGPEFSSTSDLKDQAASTQQQNTLLQSKMNLLKAKSASLSKYIASLKGALLALPADSGLPEFTRQLSAQAAANDVVLSSVVVGSASPVAGAAPAAAATTPDDGTSSTAPASTGTATTPSDPNATTAGGLYALQITLRSSGTLSHQLAFLDDVRTIGPRRALILSTQLSPGVAVKSAPSIHLASLTTQLTIFTAPQTPAQLAQLKQLLSGKLG